LALLFGFDIGPLPVSVTRTWRQEMQSFGWLGPSPFAFAGIAHSSGVGAVLLASLAGTVQTVQMGSAFNHQSLAGPSLNTGGVSIGLTVQFGYSSPVPPLQEGITCPDPN
jgi:hypothetical protein